MNDPQLEFGTPTRPRGGRRRLRPVAWTAMVVLQTFILVASLILPAMVVANEPSSPPPTEEPAPPADPTPGAGPAGRPDRGARPPADPAEEPAPPADRTQEPAPPADPTQEPAPPADPTQEPAPPADPTQEPAPPADPTEEPAPPADPTQEPAPPADPTQEPSAPDPTPIPGPRADYIVTFVSGTSDAAQVAVVDQAGATTTDKIPQLSMRAVEIPELVLADTLTALRANPAVVRVEADKVREASANPSDTRWSDQWSLPRIGWDLAFGAIDPGGSAVVAVLDTGVDASHPDLAGKLVAGRSIVAGQSATDDPNGHGTWMAGIVAAATDNGIGVAGVGYDGVRVMPVTVLGTDGTGLDSDVIEGLVWAADNGADVALMAFSNPGASASLQAAIDYAWSRGLVLVAAVANDASSANSYPAGDAGVIGVSATNRDDALTASSNFGASVFLAAPGIDIPTIQAGGGTATIDGTSAAAAHVAGAAALLKAADGSLSNGEIAGRLAATADVAGDGTGNGRVNLYRALTTGGTPSVKPAGAPDGGPFVGPYVIASQEDYKHYGDKAPAGWQNGALQGSNSLYFEGEVVPHYWTSSKLVAGQAYAINIYYDYLDGSYCGFTGMTQYNVRSRSPAPIGSAPAQDADVPLFWGTGVNVTSVSAPLGAGIQRYVTVTFTPTGTGTQDNKTIELYWGLRLAAPGALAGCSGARAWPGASLQTDVRDVPALAGATMLGGGGSLQINPSAIINGTISGLKWNDVDGASDIDASEPKLGGWVINVTSAVPNSTCTNNIVGTATTAATTGLYSISVTPGTYYVCEVPQAGGKSDVPDTALLLRSDHHQLYDSDSRGVGTSVTASRALP